MGVSVETSHLSQSSSSAAPPPRSPAQILASLDNDDDDDGVSAQDMENRIHSLEERNAKLLGEYEQLRQQRLRMGLQASPAPTMTLPPSPPVAAAVIPQSPSSTASSNEDADMVAEAKLLRVHKGRLEARMQILE